MDLKQYLRVLRGRWPFIALCTLAAVAAAGLYTGLQVNKYAATTQLFISTSGANSDTASAAYQGGLFGQQRVKSYADIVSSQPVLQRVKEQLNLPDPIDRLAQEVKASAPADTVLLDVTVEDRSAARAQAIADVLGRQFAQRVNELETPQGSAVSPVKVSVAQPPTLPQSPVSPRRKLDLLLGVLVGLAVGVSAAVLRETLDSRVRDPDTAAAVAGTVVLGGFREDGRVRSRPLIVDEDSFSGRAEAFRQLRTNIRFLAVDSPVRSIVVTSSVAAEGKSSVASNLALAIAQSGERVILVDGDLRRPVLGETLGLNPQIGLTNLLLEPVALESVLQTYGDGMDLRVLTSGPTPPNPSELLGSRRMREVLLELQDRSSIVIFDTPPLLPVTDAAVLATLTDGALLVVRANSTHRDQVRMSTEALRRVGAHVYGVVLNRLPARNKAYGYGYEGGYAPRVKTEHNVEVAQSTNPGPFEQ